VFFNQRDRWAWPAILALSLIGVGAQAAFAHVKWFADFDYATVPKTVSELSTGTFWSMFVLAIVMLLACVVLDKRVSEIRPLQNLASWFDRLQGSSLLVMRVATFATLLVAWQMGTLFAPELVVNNAWVERLQFFVLLMLLGRRTTVLAGVGLAAIWFYGAYRFGIFHMLDYVNVLGVAYFLITRPLANPFWEATALPVLYASLGFSLMWLACEKLVYPQWVNYLLEQKPILTLGLDRDFFRVASAFIELGLGFMLMIGLFGRSLSVTITLVFFLTTIIFGKVEIIGHTLIHAALIVFLLEGPGHGFRPPAALHRTLGMRLAFAGVNFTIVVFAMLFGYTLSAERVEARAMASMEHHHTTYEMPAGIAAPTLQLEVHPDSKEGWNLHLVTTNFHFAPAKVGGANEPGHGHAHLHVDGQKEARVYSEWYYLPPLGAGPHEIRVSLNTNDHSVYTEDGKPIEAVAKVDEK
jgi:hypothetical protein